MIVIYPDDDFQRTVERCIVFGTRFEEATEQLRAVAGASSHRVVELANAVQRMSHDEEGTA